MGSSLRKDSILSSGIIRGSTTHCVMIGLDLSGKTTILYRLKLNKYVNCSATIGFNCEKIRINGNLFVVWDAGGQDKLRPLWPSYTRRTNGIIFVVDSSSSDERLEEAKLELRKASKTWHKQTPLLILANKQDLEGAMNAAQLYSSLGVDELSLSRLCHVHPVCALNGDGLQDAMEKLHSMIAQGSSRKLKRVHSRSS